MSETTSGTVWINTSSSSTVVCDADDADDKHGRATMKKRMNREERERMNEERMNTG
jgi:hypothetical protein